MLTRMKKMLKKEKGFTLVELLAVIAILAIIVAIAVPSVGKIISDSKTDATNANIELVENAARLADVSGVSTGEGDDEYTIEELIQAGFLDVDQSDENFTLTGNVKVTEEDGVKSYSYTGTEGTE